MPNQVDWTKVTLMIMIVATGGYSLKDKISLPDWNLGTVSRSIPDPTPEARQAVQPIMLARGGSPLASKVLGEYFADFAWMVANGETDEYTTGTLELQLNRGGRQLLTLKEEESNLSPAINKSLDALWGSTNRQIGKGEAASAIYAIAWALR